MNSMLFDLVCLLFEGLCRLLGLSRKKEAPNKSKFRDYIYLACNVIFLLAGSGMIVWAVWTFYFAH